MAEKKKKRVMVVCPNCRGSGSESHYVGMGLGGTGKYPMYDTKDCYMCKGTGKVEAEVAEE